MKRKIDIKPLKTKIFKSILTNVNDGLFDMGELFRENKLPSITDFATTNVPKRQLSRFAKPCLNIIQVASAAAATTTRQLNEEVNRVDEIKDVEEININDKKRLSIR